MPTFHLGIEVAKAKLDCALRLPHEKFRTKAVANTPHGYAELVAWLTANEALDVQVCLEATGGYWEDLAHLLATQGFTVSVVNPAQLKADAASRLTRTKTEAVEARLIAECCAERPPPPWPAASVRGRSRLAGARVAPGRPANDAHSRKPSLGRRQRGRPYR